jgi:hypothetical protein
MSSVADHLRCDTIERVGRLSIPQRIELALALGDDDLRLYMLASGRPREEAVRHLRSQRAHGRTLSRAAALEP